MATRLKKGDRVTWHTSRGTTHGKVIDTGRTPTQIKGHKVAVAPDDPQYIVRSDNSGKKAAHRSSALNKK